MVLAELVALPPSPLGNMVLDARAALRAASGADTGMAPANIAASLASVDVVAAGRGAAPANIAASSVASAPEELVETVLAICVNIVSLAATWDGDVCAVVSV